MNHAAVLARPGLEPGKWISAVLAVGMHVMLAILLFYGVRWQTHTPVAVEVELVRALPMPEPAVPPAPTIEPPVAPEPEPTPEPPKPVVKAEPVPLPPPPKPEIAVKEKPKKIEPPKPVKAAPVVEKPDPMKARLAKESQRIQQQQAVNEAVNELDKVKQAQANAQAATARARDIDKWLSAIRGKIRGNIVVPPEVRGNPEAIFDVTQLPTGEIIAARLQQTSGIPALDLAIERAILKSSPLPKPEKAELFSRTLELKFRPLEN
jgi:colicin import membrane protein